MERGVPQRSPVCFTHDARTRKLRRRRGVLDFSRCRSGERSQATAAQPEHEKRSERRREHPPPERPFSDRPTLPAKPAANSPSSVCGRGAPPIHGSSSWRLVRGACAAPPSVRLKSVTCRIRLRGGPGQPCEPGRGEPPSRAAALAARAAALPFLSGWPCGCGCGCDLPVLLPRKFGVRTCASLRQRENLIYFGG